jgi:hypothetical protein
MDEVITKCTAQDDIAPFADTRGIRKGAFPREPERFNV